MDVVPRLRRFLAELRRRRVLRVTGAYIVAAVAALEGVDTILPATRAPENTYTMLVVLAVFLLPVVVVLSWMFDLTSEGIQRTGAATGLLATGPGTGSPVPVWAHQPAPLAADGPIDSLAVLPFANASGDPDTEYLSDGLTESIINTMSRLSGIRVVPRASVFLYKDKQVQPVPVGRALNARAVVTGRVLLRGDRLQVAAELVDVAQDAQLWGEQFTRPLEDVLTVQEQVAREICRSLSVRLTREEEARLETPETRDHEAYQDYLRGRHQWNKRAADSFEKAAEHFRAAIERDPGYAAAYTGLADIYNLFGYYNFRRPTDTYPLAKASSSKALEIDPGLAEAHASLGYTTLFYDWEWEASRACFERAIELNPSYASGHQWFAWYHLAVGDFESALREFEIAQRKDPLSLIINDHLGYGYILNERWDDARRQIERTRTLDPTYSLALWRQGNLESLTGDPDAAIEAYREAVRLSGGRLALGYLGHACGVAGREDEARDVLRRLEETARSRYVSPLDRALVHDGLGETDRAAADLAEAVTDRVSDLIRLAWLPWSDALRAHTGFQAVLRAVGAPGQAPA